LLSKWTRSQHLYFQKVCILFILRIVNKVEVHKQFVLHILNGCFITVIQNWWQDVYSTSQLEHNDQHVVVVYLLCAVHRWLGRGYNRHYVDVIIIGFVVFEWVPWFDCNVFVRFFFDWTEYDWHGPDPLGVNFHEHEE